jgi:hypothetical protein
MDNLAPEPGCGTDNVQFATINWESCLPRELAKHLFDTVPNGLADEFKLKNNDGGYYVGQERPCYKQALEVTIKGIKLHMSQFAGKVKVFDDTKALMNFRNAMKECHNADPHNQWYHYMYGKLTNFGLTGMDKSAEKNFTGR